MRSVSLHGRYLSTSLIVKYPVVRLVVDFRIMQIGREPEVPSKHLTRTMMGLLMIISTQDQVTPILPLLTVRVSLGSQEQSREE